MTGPVEFFEEKFTSFNSRMRQWHNLRSALDKAQTLCNICHSNLDSCGLSGPEVNKRGQSHGAPINGEDDTRRGIGDRQITCFLVSISNDRRKEKEK